jgi:TM2 domain-containing membrane protein YozV
MGRKRCQSCGAPIDSNETECQYCREQVDMEPPQYQPPKSEQESQYQPPQYQQTPMYAYNNVRRKSKTTAGVIAILFGGFGIHKFYLGNTAAGIIYLIFSCTGIPYIIGFIEGIMYLTMSDEKFYSKYVR